MTDIEKIIDIHNGVYDGTSDCQSLGIENDREYWLLYHHGRRVAKEWREDGRWYHFHIGESTK